MTDRPIEIRGSRSEGPLSLDGEFYRRVVRAIHAGLGQDPQQITIPRPQFDPRIGFNVMLLDATQPPFRVNGRGFVCPFNQAAPGAGNVNLMQFQNNSGRNNSSVKIPVVTGIAFSGASGMRVAVRTSPGGDLITGGTGGVIDLEAYRQKVESADALPVVGGLAFASTTGATGTSGGAEVMELPDNRTGVIPIGLPVFPGELLSFIQLVAQIACVGTIYGQVWDFGSAIPTI